MGIPSYFAHIVKRYRQIIKLRTAIGPVDNLYLDSNSLIYDVVNTLKNDMSPADINDFICTAVNEKIDHLLSLIKPTKRLFITFDGVAPLAKMEQQRRRRFMTAYDNDKSSAAIFNTACITPGTVFMEQLRISVHSHFKRTDIQILISAADEVGEGEHKIFSLMRKEPLYHETTVTVVYGLDADLIMLGLLHNPVYLFRETPEFIKTLDRSLLANELYVLDLPELALRLNMANTVQPMQPVQYLNDYIFMCFFLGNDFLPHFPALNIRTNGIDRLLQTYTKCNSLPLINLASRQIIWKNVRLLVEDLAKNEHDYILVEMKKRAEQQLQQQKFSRKKEEEIDPLKERAIELYINPSEAGWEARYYSSLFGVRIDDERRKEISVNYLEGLEWTWKYYTTGCPDWRWKYKYAYPPLLADLIKFTPYFDVAFFNAKNLLTNPVKPLVQLAYVLPRPFLNLLPSQTLKTRLLADKTFSSYYPEESSTTFLWAFCRYFWEAHVIVQEPDLLALEKLVNEIY